MEQNLGTIVWAIDENMGTNLQVLYSSSAVWKHKNINYMKKKNLNLTWFNFIAIWSLTVNIPSLHCALYTSHSPSYT